MKKPKGIYLTPVGNWECEYCGLQFSSLKEAKEHIKVCDYHYE